MFVLGIDPGLSRCGFGLVRRTRSGQEAVGHGVLQTPPGDHLPSRLASMNHQLRALMAEHRPDVVVVERVFFQTNARTAMGVAQASGLALAAAHDGGCDIAQYTSNEVKLSIAGFGGATKDQVQRMVQRVLRLDTLPRPADAADALALALHHLAIAPMLRTAGAAAHLGHGLGHGLGDGLGDGLGNGLGGRAGADRIEANGLGNARIATQVGGVTIAGGVAIVRTARSAP